MIKYLFASLLLLGSTQVTLAQSSILDFYNLYKKNYETRQMHRQKLTIIKKNIANGYLQMRFTPGVGYQNGVKSYSEEMAYFVATNGNRFVVVASSYLDPQNGKFTANPSNYIRKWGLPQFYEIRNGELKYANKNYLPLATEKKMTNVCGIKDFWIKLPEYGTTIKVGSWVNGQIKTLGELRFNLAKGNFNFVKL